MPNAFASIAYTDAVRAEQERLGSAALNARRLAPEAPPGDRIGPEEAAFIAGRDGFYQASVSENGWPYVQFRGGPAGFLQVLDERTIGYADLRGNRQYVSAGNLRADGRVSLILLDYANRRRLKVLGHVRLVPAEDDPDLAGRLAVEGYPGRVERSVLVTVAALDWNCSQHIPVRLTRDELEPQLQPLKAELARLRAENAELKSWLGRPG